MRTPRTPIIQDPPASSSQSMSSPRIFSSSRQQDVVGFGAPVYFLDEADGKIQIDVMRVGNLHGACHVDWQTKDASAMAGVKYQADQGVVVFKENEYLKSFDLFVIGDEYWAPTLEFGVELSGEFGCVLSSYLKNCRVKICDDDPFPSSKYKEDLLDGKEGLKRVSGPGLFWEYFKLNLTARGMRSRTFIVLFLDQLQNFYLWFTIYVGMYLVDVLFKQSEDVTAYLWLPSRQHTAWLIGLLYFSPRFVLHFWAVQRVYLDMDGRARRFLQEGLFRKYLCYAESSRQEVKESDMLVSITEDCSEVAEAYLGALDMLGLGGKLAVLSYFILKENIKTLWACFVMPGLMLCFAATRFKILIATSADEGDKQVDMVALADETCDKYRLIAAYGQKGDISEMFQQRVQTVTKAKVNSNVVDCNNEQVPGWVGAFFVGGYIAMMAGDVLVEEQRLGVFLATIAILDQIASDFSEFYALCMQLAKSLEPLKGLTHFFNLEMSLAVEKVSSENNRAKTAKKLADVMAGSTEGATGVREQHLKFAADKLDIELCNISFEYTTAHGPIKILDDCVLAVAQATMVAIVGEHGAGRSTLLGIMGQVTHPHNGFLFMPQHLRCLHVGQEPILLSLSLLDNLTFGGTPSGTPGRLGKILKGLKMPEVVKLLEDEMAASREKAASKTKKKPQHNEVGTPAKQVHAAKQKKAGNTALNKMLPDDEGVESDDEEGDDDDDTDFGGWHERITYTDKVKIHLARALIVNPEVLVMQRPLYHFNKDTGAQIQSILKTFVERRGYMLPAGEEEEKRRPRTCFFVPEDVDQASKADKVWHLSAQSLKVIEMDGKDAPRRLDPEFTLMC